MDDLISRQQAIDTVIDELDMIDHVPQWVFDRVERRLKWLSSIQPEIIYCKDCKYSEYHKLYGDRFCQYDNIVHVVPDLHYCGYAERRAE